MRKEIVGALFTFVMLVGPSEPSTAQASSCDKPCLVVVMDQFLDEMTGNAVPALPYSPSVEVRENARRVKLADTAWRNVERVRSSVTFADPIARRYFQDLTDHSPDPEDHVDSCNRYHSGQQITNVELNTIEEGGAMTCFSSLGGSPPWGPAAEQRFPVIDPESGTVLGVTLLLYDDGRQMYVSEVFRIVGGKIALIDNIGLMLDPPVETLGFTH